MFNPLESIRIGCYNLLLKYYSRRGNLNRVKFFISIHDDINIYGHKALLLAIENEHLDIVQFLTSKGVNIDNTLFNPCIDVKSNTNNALLIATKNGNVDIIKFLISIDDNYVTKRTLEMMFYITCEYGHTSLLEYLLREYINFIGNNHYPFIQQIVRIAINHDHLPIVKILVSYGLSITIDLFKYAVCNGNLNIVKYLIDNGANVNWCDESTLIQTRHRRKYDIINYLSSKGIDCRTYIIPRTYICSNINKPTFLNPLGLHKYLFM